MVKFNIVLTLFIIVSAAAAVTTKRPPPKQLYTTTKFTSDVYSTLKTIIKYLYHDYRNVLALQHIQYFVSTVKFHQLTLKDQRRIYWDRNITSACEYTIDVKFVFTEKYFQRRFRPTTTYNGAQNFPTDDYERTFLKFKIKKNRTIRSNRIMRRALKLLQYNVNRAVARLTEGGCKRFYYAHR